MTATFAQALLEDLAPFTTPATDPNGEHASFLIALSQPFEEIFGLVMDQGFPDDADYQCGWSKLLDVDLCPFKFLGFLAQMVGVQLPAGTDDATARQLIRAEQGFQRGTAPAIISAAKRNLSGTQSVTMFERTAADGSTPDAYHFVLVVLTSEVIDAGQLQADVDAVKPGGVLWTLIQTSSWTIAELELAYATVTLAEAAFLDVDHLETDVT